MAAVLVTIILFVALFAIFYFIGWILSRPPFGFALLWTAIFFFALFLAFRAG
jgi:hypothetical protein